MIPHSKLKLALLCAAICAQQVVWAQQASNQPASATPAAATPAADTATPAAKPTKKREEPVLSDAIVVVVNDDVITRNELADRMTFIERQLKAQHVPMPPQEEFRKQVLERMIIDSAQLQLAKEDGVRVDDLMLDRYLARVAEGNKMTLQQFRDQVEHDGTPFAKFRESVRNEILMQRVREHEVEGKVQVSEAEVDNYLAAQTGANDAQQELDIAHILIGIPENASAEQIAARRSKAEDILKQLRSGADFGKMAATYSDSSSDALKGGDLGWRAQDRLPQLFLDATAKLQPGQVSGIVKSASGFHIVKLIDKRAASIMRGGGPAAAPTVQQTHVRQILIKVNQVVTAAEAKRKLQELKDRLDNKAATFEDLAKLYSNDSTASKGGDMGWIYPGDFPELDQTINALPVNGVSEPVQSQYGYHLLQVVDRKTDDVSKERQRLLARQAIRERKLEEQTQDWMRSLRDRAYVEFRDDGK